MSTEQKAELQDRSGGGFTMLTLVAVLSVGFWSLPWLASIASPSSTELKAKAAAWELLQLEGVLLNIGALQGPNPLSKAALGTKLAEGRAECKKFAMRYRDALAGLTPAEQQAFRLRPFDAARCNT